MRSLSFWARHPPTAICRSGLGLDQLLEAPERAVEPLVGVLPDAARVEHHHVGVLHGGGRRQAVGHQQPGEPLGVVLVHLAPEGPDEVGAGHPPESRERRRLDFRPWASSAHRSCGGRGGPGAAVAWRRWRWRWRRAARARAVRRARPALPTVAGRPPEAGGSHRARPDRLLPGGRTSVRVPTQRSRVPRGRRPHARRPDTRLRQRARRRPRVHDAAGRPDRRRATAPRRSPTASRSSATPSRRRPTTTRCSTRSTSARRSTSCRRGPQGERRDRRVIDPGSYSGTSASSP